MTFRLDNIFGSAPMTCLVSGRFTLPTQLTASNAQVLPSAISYTSSPGTFNAGTYTQAQPLGHKVTIFANPVAGVAGPVTNISQLPKGLPTPVTGTLGSEYVVDLSGFPGELMYAHAHIVSNVRGARTQDALVTILDQSNFNLYIQIVSYSTGAPVALAAGACVSFQVGIKDSIGV